MVLRTGAGHALTTESALCQYDGCSSEGAFPRVLLVAAISVPTHITVMRSSLQLFPIDARVDANPSLSSSPDSPSGCSELNLPVPASADSESHQPVLHHAQKQLHPESVTLTNEIISAEQLQAKINVAFWIIVSVLSSTCLVLLNKILMRAYNFSFVYTLTALHFFTGGLALRISSYCFNSFTPKGIGLRQSMLLGAVAVGSVAAMNLSLQLNSVGTYQMLKLLVIPGCMVLQYLGQGTTFSLPVLGSLSVMLVGVAIATVTDVTFTMAGLTVGLLAVVFTTQFAIWQGSKQSEFQVSAQQLLMSIAPWQTVLAGCLSLSSDWFGAQNIFNHAYEVKEVSLLLLSCGCAVVVNASSMTIIGKTSAVTFQVVGHAKTCMILATGYFLLPESAEGWQLVKNITGVCFGLLGVFMYSYFKIQQR